MGPESAKTFPGQTLVETSGLTAGRAKQEIDYGRRGKGYIFGAFRPATGEAFTRPYLSRSTACWVAFLEEVELWLPAESERVRAGKTKGRAAMSRSRQVAGLSAACGSAISVSGPCRRRSLRRNLERSPADPTQLLCRAIMALLLLLLSVWPARADDPVGGLAEAPLSLPTGPAQGLVFLFSAEAGPDAALQAAAARITALGAAVATVDFRDYLRRADATLNADCLYLVAEIEAVSRRIQSRLGRARYFSPIVAGTGLGGTLALLALAQAPDATLAGAASDGFGTALPTGRPLCPGAEATRIDGGYSYAPTMRWPGFVRVGAGPSELAVARDWLTRSGLPPETVSVSDPAVPLADRLAALLEAPIRAQQAETTALGQLPIIELPVEQPGRLMAVVLSGDGGWRDLDEEIGGYMQKAGVPVIGLELAPLLLEAQDAGRAGGRPRPDHAALSAGLGPA